jgi:hypothetical protein
MFDINQRACRQKAYGSFDPDASDVCVFFDLFIPDIRNIHMPVAPCDHQEEKLECVEFRYPA